MFRLILLLTVLNSLAFSEFPFAHEKPASVVTRIAKLTEISDSLRYPSRVIPKVNTTILSEIDGIVSTLSTPLGQSVKAGQKLMTLTHTDPIYQYAPLTVLSPVSGVVSQVEITVGTQVTKGQKLLSVTDPLQIRISTEVPAQDLGSLTKGVPGIFTPTGTSEGISIKVKGVSPFVDPATGTATAELEPIAKVTTLRPGLMGLVAFTVNTHSGFEIPEHAIYYKGNNTFIRLLENGKAKQVSVVLGKKRRGYVEILKGLYPNATFIEQTSRYLADGESVTVEGSQ